MDTHTSTKPGSAAKAADGRYLHAAVETMPREQLQALQLARLRDTVRNAWENVPLHRSRLDAAGVKPEDIDGSGLQGLKAQMIIHAAIESLNTGRVVYLDEMFPNYI